MTLKVDFWEGGRRVRIALAVLILIGGLATYVLSSDSTTWIDLETRYPGDNVKIVDTCSFETHREYLVSAEIGGETANVDLCFEKDADGRIMYQAVKERPGYFLTGTPEYPDAAAYIEERKKMPVVASDQPRVARAIAAARAKENRGFLWSIMVGVFAALAVLYGVTWGLGWIVKGFASKAPTT